MLRGWLDLTSDKPHIVKKSTKFLEQGIQDAKDVLGLMGKVGSGRERGGEEDPHLDHWSQRPTR